uniref:Uncharacterized protein n=1 Tax=Lepeophtheirus salmonis TaxID=72036 RepID=A0A0K2UDG2_LEPSM
MRLTPSYIPLLYTEWGLYLFPSHRTVCSCSNYTS